jgi:hypothetical protein
MLSLDLALQKHASISVCGYDSTRLYVRDVIDIDRPERNEVIYAEMERQIIRYDPAYVVVEKNTLQSGFYLDDRFLEMKARYGFQTWPHHTGANKHSPQYGVPAMMNAIVRLEIEFPGLLGEQGHHGLTQLFEQCLAWRADVPTKMLTQDHVMSLWMDYLLWRQIRDQIAPDLSGWTRDGLDDPTMYPGAQVDVQRRGGEELIRRPKTYEDEWAELVASNPV